ncbi:MAG TPA: hypothetical protein VGQ04_01630, partial [Chitinophagaceae bacterium]|nr:hypothetical protein [Chitinophagaceae bacterium]
MRNTLPFILYTIISLGSYAQTDNKIIIGKVDSVYSTTLKEQRKVWVYTPTMKTGEQIPGQR